MGKDRRVGSATMTTALVTVPAVAALLTGGLVIAVLGGLTGGLVGSRSGRRRADGELASLHGDVATLGRRADELSASMSTASAASTGSAVPTSAVPTSAPATSAVPVSSVLITDAGHHTDSADRVVSARLSDPLVTAVAFGYGVRQALRPESRNRIRFAMRQELKRSRKARRQHLRNSRRPAPEQRDDPSGAAA